MRGREMFSCPTGDMIRELIISRRMQELRAEIEPCDEVDGVVLVIEQTPGIRIVLCTTSDLWRLLSQYDVLVTTDVPPVHLWKRPDGERCPIERLLQHTHKKMVPENSYAETADSPLCRIDRMAGMREWERRNQYSFRPPRRLLGKKQR